MADGIILEEVGVPTAVVCTDAFVGSAEAMARMRGFPGFPYVAVPHPTADLTEVELMEISSSFIDEVIGILLTSTFDGDA